MGFEFGVDGDGVPRTVTMEMGTVVFDRRNPTNPVPLDKESSSRAAAEQALEVIVELDV